MTEPTLLDLPGSKSWPNNSSNKGTDVKNKILKIHCIPTRLLISKISLKNGLKMMKAHKEIKFPITKPWSEAVNR